MMIMKILININHQLTTINQPILTNNHIPFEHQPWLSLEVTWQGGRRVGRNPSIAWEPADFFHQFWIEKHILSPRVKHHCSGGEKNRPTWTNLEFFGFFFCLVDLRKTNNRILGFIGMCIPAGMDFL